MGDKMESVANVIAAKGGRLGLGSIGGAASQHLDFAAQLFRGYLEPVLVSSRNSAVTRATPPSKISEFAFVARWDINAWAILAEERPIVLFHAGVPFALTALFNSLLSQTTLAPDLYDGGSLEARAFRAPRLEWSNIPKDHSPDVDPIVGYLNWLGYQSPPTMSGERQQYATHAYLTAMNFLFCHELGHIDRGHLELRRHFGFSLEENPSRKAATSSNSADIQVLRALEFEADWYSISKTVKVFRTPDETAEMRQIRYRRTAFAIGAVFLFLECARQPSGLFPRLLRVLSMNEGTHPEPLLRIRYLLICLHVTAGQEKQGREWIDEALRQAVDDLRAAAKLLRVKSVETLPYPKDDLSVGQAVEPMRLKLENMETALEACRKAVSERYYLNGTLLQDEDPAPPAADPYYLRNQSRVYQADNKDVHIPFLEATSPAEAFLQSSEAWEKLGYLDDAMLYAMYAAQRAPDSAVTHARIEDLDARLQPYGPLLREMLTDAGLPVRLADKFDVGIDEPSELYEMFALVRPNQMNFKLDAAHARYAGCDWSGALSVFEEVASHREADSELLNSADEGAGNCHVELGQTELAVACFNRALERDPDRVSALTNLGIGLIRGGRAAEALAPLERAINLKPSAADLRFFASAAHHALGDLASTRRHLERALELAPDELKYHSALEQLRAEEALRQR
ncbi:tetratricopeptide repeat protein [Rhizobium leguminosarum]|uniref:hypothetical protein n=1 Tax=Rhizobium leguminosarum TaxID=384 RepID=UPI003F9E3FF8